MPYEVDCYFCMEFFSLTEFSLSPSEGPEASLIYAGPLWFPLGKAS